MDCTRNTIVQFGVKFRELVGLIYWCFGNVSNSGCFNNISDDKFTNSWKQTKNVLHSSDFLNSIIGKSFSSQPFQLMFPNIWFITYLCLLDKTLSNSCSELVLHGHGHAWTARYSFAFVSFLCPEIKDKRRYMRVSIRSHLLLLLAKVSVLCLNSVIEWWVRFRNSVLNG